MVDEIWPDAALVARRLEGIWSSWRECKVEQKTCVFSILGMRLHFAGEKYLYLVWKTYLLIMEKAVGEVMSCCDSLVGYRVEVRMRNYGANVVSECSSGSWWLFVELGRWKMGITRWGLCGRGAPSLGKACEFASE